MDYKFTQHVTREDYVAFVTNHMKLSFFKPVNMILFAISIGYLMVSPFILGNGDFTFLFIGLAIILLLVGMSFYARKNAGKQYDKDPDQFNMTYEVNDEGLVYITAEGDLTKTWSEFYSAVEVGEYIYVYVNKNSGMVLIKRDMSGDTLRFIKQKVTEHVNSKKVKLLENE